MEQQFGQLRVLKLGDREELGSIAACDAAAQLHDIVKAKGEANVVFAAAPSQKEFLNNLIECDTPFGSIRAFHMDEYIGLPEAHLAWFCTFLDEAIFRKRTFMEVHYIGKIGEPQKTASLYAELLEKYPPDVIFLGIGENGHLAFNDPPVADFDDPYSVKIVELDRICRQQQVNDGAFSSLEEVPKTAITITMSFIMTVPHAFVMVPGIKKANAVQAVLKGPITTACPASILRRHPDASLYLDPDSASLI